MAEQAAGFTHYVAALDQHAFLEPSLQASGAQAQDGKGASLAFVLRKMAKAPGTATAEPRSRNRRSPNCRRCCQRLFPRG
ncbi:hypothetical protein MES4922_10040 [Mesorhizobium ventifaucium]|uniref:Uncharacterized protein n=1 Tax=Mesorhizobium ventifaucium TaxID=666020 RepID=A0ABM9DC75_9HYPH|nr:hypothetical protein MES4922_10040 [Mesorhizobium ventifaucium]